jgi:hypothetical protein
MQSTIYTSNSKKRVGRIVLAQFGRSVLPIVFAYSRQCWRWSVILIVAITITRPCNAVAPVAEGTADGALAYRQNCAKCHGANLQGAAGPGLTGLGFDRRWLGKERELYTPVTKTMPLDAPASLSPLTYAAVTGFLLHQGAQDASQALSSDTLGRAQKLEADASPVGKLSAEAKRFRNPATDVPGDDELLRSAPEDWLRYNRDYRSQRFSPLGAITRGTLDGHLIALDATNGELVWNTWVADSAKGYFLSAAPTVAVASGNSSKLVWKSPGGPIVLIFGLPGETI